MDKSTARDKRRVDKHHKQPHPDKRKVKIQSGVKNQATTVTVTPKPENDHDISFAKRPIEPNRASSYELPSDRSDSEDDQLDAADFEKLLQMPSTTSGHFVLSTEKQWMNEAVDSSLSSGNSSQRYGKYFRIDTKELNACLSTIPLYERNGYPREIFRKQEIDSMDLKAHYESKKYEENLQKFKSKKQQSLVEPKSSVDKSQAAPIAPSIQQEKVITPIMQLESAFVDSLILTPDPNKYESRFPDSISKEKTSETINKSKPEQDIVPIGCNNEAKERSTIVPLNNSHDQGRTKATTESKEDIQRWLDDILDM